MVTWKGKAGAVAPLNQPLVDIETAKATVELPSPYAGTIVALHGNVGDVMEVHKPLITFDVGGSGGPAPASAPTADVAPDAPAPAKEASDKEAGSRSEEHTSELHSPTHLACR